MTLVGSKFLPGVFLVEVMQVEEDSGTKNDRRNYSDTTFKEGYIRRIFVFLQSEKFRKIHLTKL